MIGFKAYVYDGAETARGILAALRAEKPHFDRIGEIAEVSRQKDGTIAIHSTWAQDDGATGKALGAGAVAGALAGALLSAMFSPPAVPFGAALGGSLGAGFGAVHGLSLADPRLEDFASALDRDTSALILVAEEEALAHFEPPGGYLIQSTLSAKDIEALRRAIVRAEPV